MTDRVSDVLAEWREAMQALRELDPSDPGYKDAEQALIDAAARFGRADESDVLDNRERDRTRGRP